VIRNGEFGCNKHFNVKTNYQKCLLKVNLVFQFKNVFAASWGYRNNYTIYHARVCILGDLNTDYET
jgi:hypothetical protein